MALLFVFSRSSTAGLTKLTRKDAKTQRRKDATKYRDALMARVSPNSVNRYNNTIKAVLSDKLDGTKADA